MALGLGIGIQNFPQGKASFVPLKRDGCTRVRTFRWGESSDILARCADVAAVLLTRPLLARALSPDAGAMIVVPEGLGPEAHRGLRRDAVCSLDQP